MKHKILFVDDCSTTLLIEQMLLSKRIAYNLIMARDGREAVQKAAAELPDLILMDATQPNIEACREIRKIDELRRIPILLVTTCDEPSNVEDGCADACDQNMASPPHWRGLFEMIHAYLAGRGVNG